MPDDPSGGPLRPYEGPDEVRLRHLGEAHAHERYATDESGTVRYAFHELGYRGPSPSPDAVLRVLVAGESDAFGLGVAWEDAWPVRVVERLRADLGLAEADVALLNIADCGIGNESIARQLVSQCEAFQPDVVLLNLADHRRTEGVCEGEVFHIGEWFEHPGADREVERIAARRGDERPYRMVARGRQYLGFSDGDHDLLASLRALLWMQEYLLRREVAVFATCRPELMPEASAVNAANRAIAPLLGMIDRRFLRPHDQRQGEAQLASDGQHFGPDAHAAIAASVWRRFEAGDELSRLAEVAAGRRRTAPVGARVRSFYGVMPFNLHGSVAAAARSIREHDLASIYPDLHRHLASGGVRRVVEFGCGAGWLACTLAEHYRVEVTAVDFTASALERARAVADALGVAERVRFVESDLHAYEPAEPVDLVVSVGVLHHTEDARAAFAHVQRFVADRGAVYLGLYHEPGRRPFLAHFRGLVEREGEDAALARYRELDGVQQGDDVMLRSWFRDQVLHPHESQHTLREVCGWFDDAGLRMRSTSINRFGAVDDEAALFASEQDYEERSRRALHDERRYFPGFFTALAVRG